MKSWDLFLCSLNGLYTLVAYLNIRVVDVYCNSLREIPHSFTTNITVSSTHLLGIGLMLIYSLDLCNECLVCTRSYLKGYDREQDR
jgi:hypothetical protein